MFPHIIIIPVSQRRKPRQGKVLISPRSLRRRGRSRGGHGVGGAAGRVLRQWQRGSDAGQLRTWSLGPGHQGVNPDSGKNMFTQF